jgi:hypothetical protein
VRSTPAAMVCGVPVASVPVHERVRGKWGREKDRDKEVGTYTKNSTLNLQSLLHQPHVPQHHQTTQQQRSRVGKTLAGNVGGGSVDGLEDAGVLANVTGRGESESSDQSGAHVGEDVSVELQSTGGSDAVRKRMNVSWTHVGHDHDSVSVRGGVLNDPEADTVEEILVVLDVRVLDGEFSASAEEHSIGHLPTTSTQCQRWSTE